MTESNSILLYVTNAPAAARFYAGLLGSEPIEASPTFAMFILPSGLALGLWGKDGVEPAPEAAPGGSELGFKVNSPAEVDRIHSDWEGAGVKMGMPPTDLDFGRSFVALDPDGLRLRVYAVAEEG